MNAIPEIKEKSKGAVVAFAIGDALGWPNERRSVALSYNKNYISNFKQWNKKSGGRYWSHTEMIMPGEYSDDTQLMLAISRSLLSGSDWSEYFTKHELPFWRQYERGGGNAVLKAAEQWSKGKKPWENKDNRAYYYAGGNGSAMRVLPHIIRHAALHNLSGVYREIVKDAILTHGHPRAVLGALCYAYAASYLLSKTSTLDYCELIAVVIQNISSWGEFPEILGEDWLIRCEKYYNYRTEWCNTRELIVRELKIVEDALSSGALEIEHDTLMALGCFDTKVNGAGDIAAVAAIYFVSKYANNPALGIKQAANLFGADTDTIAAMTGGLMGSLCGLEWIPYEWRLVQDYKCLDLIGECLISYNGAEELKGYIAKNSDNEFERIEIGKAKKIDQYIINSGKSGKINITKYITILGQTIYVKDFKRIKSNDTTGTTFTVFADKLGSLLKKDSSYNITLEELLQILKLRMSGDEPIIIADKLYIRPDIVANLLDLFDI